MKPAAFAYAKARSLDDAIRLLGAHQGDAKLLAGGQSLIATLNMRLSSPSLLVDINGVGLDGIALKNGMVEIGALMRTALATRTGVLAGGRAAFDLVQAAADSAASPARRYGRFIGRSSARSSVGSVSGPSW